MKKLCSILLCTLMLSLCATFTYEDVNAFAVLTGDTSYDIMPCSDYFIPIQDVK